MLQTQLIAMLYNDRESRCRSRPPDMLHRRFTPYSEQ